MIQKTKYLLLGIAICSLVFSIHIAIKNYNIRKYLKLSFEIKRNDTISPKPLNISELHALFYGLRNPNDAKIYYIKDIEESIKNDFNYFTGISLNDKKLNYSIVVFDKENNIRRYFDLISTDVSNTHFIIKPKQ